ncbi:inorganic phosphate transporter [Lysinibacillus fusiformis]|uniref:inorganic phosphate transporter n=1 Tax=Lysinibacillus TaxID=400634 RepID=UPI000501280C|nr:MULTISPECIES: inorganic phosphate transporter [Lysinibacillus]KAB0444571.1 inorganic phosphate transporter [Lysinibacillus fusiformis]KGA84548.1 sulfate permease [Lysinibacillus fusiformis]MCE4045051.1 inorganic phosphate transporter family protein [Lysinibacillus fusiformis]MCT6817153.1 anion permease [Lysinibacillus fusiformis]MCT6929530.1 anion permease [Lysinibacillus fusiformis]
MLEYFAIAISLFFAMNIGASGAAASMGVAYGAGAIKKAWQALLLCAIGVYSGAVLGGGEVVKTISSGIMPQEYITVKIVIIILISATSSLFFANLLGIPLSTSEVTVGAVVGVGMAYKVLFVQSLLVIMSFWVIVPLIAFVIALICGKLLYKVQHRGLLKDHPILTVLLLLAGFFEAFSAGMNNVANAVGPLVGAGMMDVTIGIMLGGAFVAIGAILLGKRVLETNGKKIMRFQKAEGILISSTGALLVGISSIFGLPVPLTQVTSSSIIGMGMAKNGKQILHKHIVKKIIRIWVVSPIFSLAISYFLVQLFLEKDLYAIILNGSIIVGTLGVISLMRTMREEEQSIYDAGEGI